MRRVDSDLQKALKLHFQKEGGTFSKRGSNIFKKREEHFQLFDWDRSFLGTQEADAHLWERFT